MDDQQDQTPAHFSTPVSRPSPRGHAVIAWIVIALLSVIMVLGHMLAPSPPTQSGPSDDSLVVSLMSFQSQVLIGVVELLEGGDQHRLQMYEQNAKPLNTGTVGQRQRFIVLTAELAGVNEARLQLEALDDLIAQEQAEGERVMSEEHEQVQRLLYTLYADGGDDPMPNVSALSADQRQLLEQELGWLGELAIAPRGMDHSQRARLMHRAKISASVFLIALLLGGTGLLVGSITLIVLLILTLSGSLRSGMIASQAHHGIYAETFAVWIVLFFAMQAGGGLLASVFPIPSMMMIFVMFFLSLVALAWPVLRGIRWSEVREDIGLTWGRRPALEPAVGVLGYLMGLPMLVVGLVLTMLLMVIHSNFTSAAGGPLAPAGGPSHPVVDQLAGTGWLPIVQILLVAAVAAPIVEEIMFRGVLYRHLRAATDASLSQGAGHRSDRGATFVSILLSSTLNGFLFAVIHPQGLLAVPALMSLAYAFSLVREWRGTIIPSIIIHAISNALVMSMLTFMIRSGAG